MDNIRIELVEDGGLWSVIVNDEIVNEELTFDELSDLTINDINQMYENSI